MGFHVYIERPADTSPQGKARLASVIAQKFRLPEAQVAQHLAAGRFRVKSNVDEPTARKFAGELEAMGAVTAIADAETGAPLAARPAASEGVALGSGSISLGSLGGEDVPAFEPTSLAAPSPPRPAARAAAATPAPKPKLEQRSHDPFAPPEEAEELGLQLADSPAKPPPRPATARPPVAASPPPVSAAAPAAAGPPRATTVPAPRRPPAPRRVGGPLQHHFASELKRTVVGVLLAVVLGFAPATLIASLLEASAYATPVARVNDAQQGELTTDQWDELSDQIRPAALEDMKRRRGRIKLVTVVVWIGASGALSWFWFRKLT